MMLSRGSKHGSKGWMIRHDEKEDRMKKRMKFRIGVYAVMTLLMMGRGAA